MFDQAIVRTGIRFGVLCALAGFILTLALYFSGLNPYGKTSLASLIFVPVFIFVGLSNFKKYNDENIGFLKAFRVALSITFYAAAASAMILYIFSTFAGASVIQRHIADMKEMMAVAKAETIKLIGEANYNLTLAQLDKTTPADLAADDFMKKTLTGFLTSIVAATFFRK